MRNHFFGLRKCVSRAIKAPISYNSALLIFDEKILSIISLVSISKTYKDLLTFVATEQAVCVYPKRKPKNSFSHDSPNPGRRVVRLSNQSILFLLYTITYPIQSLLLLNLIFI